jgi:type II secretory pathway pseudopilin PulG
MKQQSFSSIPPASHREQGFTLVEALTAIVILAFGLIAITNLMIVAASSNSVANQSTAATTAASQVLEQLRAAPFETLVANTGDVTADVAGFFRDDDFTGVGHIHTRWRIDAFVPANPRALFITVRSEGTGALSGARSRAEFTTIRTCTNAAIGC